MHAPVTALDDRLKAFLDAVESERDEGVTLRSVANTQRNLADAFVAHERTCELRWQKYGDESRSIRVRTEGLEGKVDRLEDAEEDTGQHILALDGRVERVKEVAERARSLPPALKAINWVSVRAATVAEKWLTHLAMAVLTLVAAYLIRLLVAK